MIDKGKRRFLPVLLLACLGLVSVLDGLRWVPWKLAWTLSGSPHPPASSFHVFDVENGTQDEILVAVYNLNDRRIEEYTHRESLLRERLGWVTEKEYVLRSGDTETVVLPSIDTRSLALLLVVAVKEPSVGHELTQELAFYLVSNASTRGAHPIYEKHPGDRDLLKFYPADFARLPTESASFEPPKVLTNDIVGE